MDFKYATLTFLHIFQKTVECKLPLLRWGHHEANIIVLIVQLTLMISLLRINLGHSNIP